MKKREKRIFVYGGPQVFYAAEARPSGHPNAPAYVLETEHLRMKAQRDRLLEAARRAEDCIKDRPGPYGGTLQRLRAAIAECEGP